MSNLKDKKILKLTKSLQTARDELRVLRGAHRELNREEAFQERLLRRMNAKINMLKPTSLKVNWDEHVASEWGNVIGISDWHIGEVVDSKQTNYKNTFNYTKAEKRIEDYISKSINMRTKSRKLVLADLGDNIRGIIHNGLEDSEDGIMESLIRCTDMIANVIMKLLEHYEYIDYRFVVGNHSRLEEHIKAKNKYKDYSWLVVQMLIRMFKNEERIGFNISETGYHLVKINKAYVFMFHGDTVRWYNPSSDTSRSKLQDLCYNLFGKQAIHFFSGHKHTALTNANQYGGFNIVSGTLVGNNEYGVQSGFSMIHPSQCSFNVELDGSIRDIHHYILK